MQSRGLESDDAVVPGGKTIGFPRGRRIYNQAALQALEGKRMIYLIGPAVYKGSAQAIACNARRFTLQTQGSNRRLEPAAMNHRIPPGWNKG